MVEVVNDPLVLARYRLARLGFWLNRFRTLPRAKRLFGDAKLGTVLERPLFGYTFVCNVARSSVQALLYLEGERFIAEKRLVQKLLRPGFRVVDVGANIGYYTLLFAKSIGANGTILAIEPSPENLSELRLNLDRNSLHSMVEVVEAAVGDRNDFVGVRPGINSGVVGIGAGAYSVAMRTLDDIVKDRIDFLKVDIEGYEWAAIKGAERILADYRPILFLEIHPWNLMQKGVSLAALIDKLKLFYKDITLFRPNTGGSAFQKMLRRYFRFGLIVEIGNIDCFVGTFGADDDMTPFWAVCR